MSSSDFRADRIRGHRFILSGSSSANPAFMIYSASVANDLTGGIKYPGQGGFDPTPAGGIGDDVFLVVSGTLLFPKESYLLVLSDYSRDAASKQN